MKKILSVVFSFYQFWMISILIAIVLVWIPKTILQFRNDEPAKIDNVKKIARPTFDSSFIYNQQKTVRIEPSEYTVAFEARREITYSFIYKAIQIVLMACFSFFLFKVLASIQHDDPFIIKLDIWLNRIGFLLLLMWITGNIYEIIMNKRMHFLGFNDFEIDENQGPYLLLAIIAFAFAKIFKKGKEYKEENDLTV